MKKILIADDSPISRNLMKTLLLKSYEVVESENGSDALAKAKANDIDLFLLDLNMPGMSGIGITIELRKDPKYSKKPIIILTSEVRDERKQEGKDAGVTGWIVKDVDQQKLLDVINQLI
jgi:two-component system, chemotaxis family, chemotaxis protein CheY